MRKIRHWHIAWACFRPPRRRNATTYTRVCTYETHAFLSTVFNDLTHFVRAYTSPFLTTREILFNAYVHSVFYGCPESHAERDPARVVLDARSSTVVFTLSSRSFSERCRDSTISKSSHTSVCRQTQTVGRRFAEFGTQFTHVRREEVSRGTCADVRCADIRGL